MPDVFTGEEVRTATTLYGRYGPAVAGGNSWEVFDRPPAPPEYSPRRDYDDAAMTGELMVILSFRVPDGPMAADREGDSWVVTGTVSGLYALAAFWIVDAGSGEYLEGPPRAAALSPARLVLGPDRHVRELRLDGLAFSLDLAEPIPPEIYASLRATTSTIRLTDLGTPVTIQVPPPGRLVPVPTP